MSAGQFAPSGIISFNDNYDSDLPESCRGDWRPEAPSIVNRCPCGTRLNRYNLGPLCNPCKHKAADPDKIYSRETSPRFQNTTGLKGVIPHGTRFRAQRQVHGVKMDLGIHDTPQAAHEAWKQAKAAALLPSDRLGPDHATQVDTP